YQEYSTIREDLDNQVNAAYQKRTRTMGKSKKTKRPGGAGGGSHYVGGAAGADGRGISKPAIGSQTESVLQRRQKWIDIITPVFEKDIGRIPKSSIFEGEIMDELIRTERD